MIYASPDDNTDLNASTSAHGLLKKLSNVSTEFMNGQGNWATPSGGGSAIEVQDEGTPLTTAVKKFNFAGSSVVVTEPVTDEVLVTIASSPVETLASAMARRTTSYTLTTSFSDITFNSTDVETDNTIVDHDLSGNSDRIIVKETGTYLVAYNTEANTTGVQRDVSLRLRINDTTVIDGSDITDTVYDDYHRNIGWMGIVELTANDYISLQAEQDIILFGSLVAGTTTLKVIKLDGVKGDKGDTGASGGSTVVMSDYLVGTTSNPSTTATTSGTAVTIAQMTKTWTVSDASNVIDVYFNGNFYASGKNTPVSARVAVFVDGTIKANTERHGYADSNTEDYISLATQWSGTLSVASHTITIRMWVSAETLYAHSTLRNLIIKETDE